MPDKGEYKKKEVVLRGVGVSPGVAVAPAYQVITEDDRYVERNIDDDEISQEIARFEDALISTRQQIHDIQNKIADAIGQENASIFDAHLLVVDDRSFVEEVIKELELKRKNVETVLYQVAKKYADALSNVQDDYLRERAADVKDVARRILRNLAGRKVSSLADLTDPCIVVTNDLSPSDTAMMRRDTVVAFATDMGSRTSHTAIMARALEIPAVVGLHDVSVRVRSGDQVLVDGNKGLLVLNPSLKRLERYGEIAEMQRTIRSSLQQLRNVQSETLDGYNVALAANIEVPEEVDAVIEHGATAGVGLFRSEFLYLASTSLPTEKQQEEAYAQVASRLAPAPVVVRTLDLGGDKFLSELKMPQEMNPFMGWRAIRYCLANPQIFMKQLRAILRASCHSNVRLMYPMVSNVDEVILANNMLEAAKKELRDKGEAFNEDIQVGVMIEIPSAALTAELIAPHVSFFSLGTNDLVQYTLAVDRVNEHIAYLYKPTHPAIIKLIHKTIEVGHQYGIQVAVCGEMAGNVLLAPLLVGLGADELSVSPSLIPIVKRIIRNITYSQAEELALTALSSESAKEVQQLCRELVLKVAPDLLKLVE